MLKYNTFRKRNVGKMYFCVMNVIEKAKTEKNLSDGELKNLIETSDFDAGLFAAADEVRRQNYGNKVFIRGLIEFSNFCKNNCFYCGIRAGNSNIERYRLSQNEILECCETGYKLGFRTFVLQSGEVRRVRQAHPPVGASETASIDTSVAEPVEAVEVVEIVAAIRDKFPDCAISLSIGEITAETCRKLKEAGADRFLLRHETADLEHYAKLHPAKMSFENRRNCLFELKKLGFQVGSGFMVGSPFQSSENLISDLRFLQELQPEMIGIGPFIPHKDTPFAAEKPGTAELTLRLLAICRLFFPHALIPATTALGTIAKDGRERGLKAGANVVMPNLSPVRERKKYSLYDNKISTGEEAAECLAALEKQVKNAGYEIVVDRGDVKKSEKLGVRSEKC